MPRDIAKTIISASHGAIPVLAGLGLLAGTMLTSGSASAQGVYGGGPFAGPSSAYGRHPRARHCGPSRSSCHARGPYGPPVWRAYLPRNNALPMYNEPPPRFPER